MLLTTGQELGSQADLFPNDIDEIGHQTPKERSSQGSSRTVRRVKEKKQEFEFRIKEVKVTLK